MLHQPDHAAIGLALGLSRQLEHFFEELLLLLHVGLRRIAGRRQRSGGHATLFDREHLRLRQACTIAIVIRATAGDYGCGFAAEFLVGNFLARPHTGHRFLVLTQSAAEGLGRREEALLQAGHHDRRRGLPALGKTRDAALTDLAIFVEQLGQDQFGRVGGKPVDNDGRRLTLREAPARNLADVFLQATHHDALDSGIIVLNLRAATETLRVEKLEERAVAVGVAVMRSRRKEEAVFEAGSQVADRTCDLRIVGVLRDAGGGGVMAFVEDEQAARAQVAEEGTKRAGVSLIDQQTVRHNQVRVRLPGVGGMAALFAHAANVGAVEDLEIQSELRFQFVAPLVDHRRRTGDDYRVDTLTQEHLAGDQAGFDRLTQADVIGYEQVDARELQGLGERNQLIGVELDTSAERGLERTRVGGRHAVPAERAEIGGEIADRVEGRLLVLAADRLPSLFADDAGIDLGLPDHLQLLTLSVVVDARQRNQVPLAVRTRLDAFD